MNETPDLTALSTAFGEFGGKVFRKNINLLNLSDQGILVYRNVKAPQKLPRSKVNGEPRPYRPQDDTNNAISFDDRTLTANQSKWDFDVDVENLRNKYLAKWKPGAQSFADYCISEVSKAYLSAINNKTAYLGVYNASGTGAVDLATGWGTYIANEITATNLTPVTTTAITTMALAGSEVAKVVAQVPVWMREMGYRILCSYTTFDLYAAWYADTFKYTFTPDALGRYRINNQNAFIQPVSWMGTSQRLIATIDDNLAMGTDGDSIGVFPSIRRNIIEVRLVMPIGFQIADLDALVVNSNA